MTVPWDELGPGDPVLLRFESKFNEETTQTVAGYVSDHKKTRNDFAELVIKDDDGAKYLVNWDGKTERWSGHPDRWEDYGVDGRLYSLEVVDPIVDDIGEYELHESDRRAIDPLLDDADDLDDEVHWQSE